MLFPQSIKNHYNVFTFHSKSLFFWLIYIIFVGSLLLKWNLINIELKDNFCVNNPWCNCYFLYTIPRYIIFIYSHASRGSVTSFYKSEFFFNFWILGIAKGIVLTTWHLCRCNPLSNNGYKLVYLSVFIFIGIICVYMYIVIRMNFLVLCQVVLNLILRCGLVRQVYLKNDVKVNFCYLWV